MLQEFYTQLKRKYEGSLVKTKNATALDENAKEYLHRLAKEGLVERVAWGWYYVPDETKDAWEFLKNDKNFKIIVGQSAASFWNKDFVHRDVITLYVKDNSYRKALKTFAKKKGWKIEIDFSKELPKYIKVDNLYIQKLEENIIECIDKWAFTDALATIYENRKRINLERILKNSFWSRLPNSDIRVGQILGYAFKRLNEGFGKNIFPNYRTRLKNDFVRRSIDEAVERVIEFA